MNDLGQAVIEARNAQREAEVAVRLARTRLEAAAARLEAAKDDAIDRGPITPPRVAPALIRSMGCQCAAGRPVWCKTAHLGGAVGGGSLFTLAAFDAGEAIGTSPCSTRASASICSASSR